MSSSHIYPYVYRLDHPLTGEFYIGFRYANKVPAEDDLGYNYFTSSSSVRPRFKEFNHTIIAVFFNKDDAFHFEQELICECKNNANLLNRLYIENSTKRVVGSITKETRVKMSTAKQGRPRSATTREKIHAAWERRKAVTPGRIFLPRTDEYKKKMSEAKQGNIQSAEHLDKRSKSLSGKPLPKIVCRIIDQKEMDIQHFNQWCKRTPRTLEPAR